MFTSIPAKLVWISWGLFVFVIKKYKQLPIHLILFLLLALYSSHMADCLTYGGCSTAWSKPVRWILRTKNDPSAASTANYPYSGTVAYNPGYNMTHQMRNVVQGKANKCLVHGNCSAVAWGILAFNATIQIIILRVAGLRF